jgi:propanediol dehydratase small subunit
MSDAARDLPPAAFDPAADYPLGRRRPDLVFTPSGRPLAEVTLDAARAGELEAADVRVTAGTLRLQAEVSRAHGRAQLAEALERAAELTAVTEDEIMAVYTALRPGRSTAAELDGWASLLEERGAHATARFVREAAQVYVERGLLAG